MSLFILDLEKVTNAKTREYFREVVNSYDNGNYRSAIVVLYSVCICDIVFKLVDLSELYGDKNAEQILKEYHSKFNSNDKDRPASKSEWERKLIDEACNKGLIDTVTKERLTNLYSFRNMSAHPVLGQNYELYNPTKEETVALILAMYNRLLIQPSLFMSSIVGMLSEDLAKNRELLEVDQKQFETYISSKYFNHLSKNYLQEVFKAFWKFCFVLDNEECNVNRKINFQLLSYILCKNKEDCIEVIRNENERFGCSLNANCLGTLVELLAQFPFIYKSLGTVVCTNIESFLERDYRSEISWFMFDSPMEFVNALKTRWKVQSIATDDKIIFEAYFKDNDNLSLMFDFYIYLFSNSRSFDDSRNNWCLLENKIGNLSNSQLKSIVEAVNTNSQIYNNWISPNICKRIKKEFADRQIDFDFTKYPNFGISLEARLI